MNDAIIDVEASAHTFMVDAMVESELMKARLRAGMLTPEQQEAATVTAMELAEFVSAISGITLPCPDRP